MLIFFAILPRLFISFARCAVCRHFSSCFDDVFRVCRLFDDAAFRLFTYFRLPLPRRRVFLLFRHAVFDADAAAYADIAPRCRHAATLICAAFD